VKSISGLIKEFEEIISTRTDEQAIEFLFSFFAEFPIPAWIKTFDKDGHIRVAKVNLAYEEAFGLDTDTVLNREIQQELNEVKEWISNDFLAIQKGGVIKLTEEVTHKDGHTIPIFSYKWPLRTLNMKGVCGIAIPDLQRDTKND
tara:strand:+ start:84 stop:518 length:435 start_codon:yes stop_codon:yes gene_type:complete